MSRSGDRPASLYSAAKAVVVRGRTISYLSPLLAIIVGILHAALAPVIVVGGVKPNLILVAVVLVTVLVGFLPGIVWAFTAGVTANLLVGDPLGSIPLAMLVVALIAAAGARPFGRMVWVYPILATLVGSAVADIVVLGASQLVAAAPASLPGGIVVSAAILNAAIAALLLYPARLLVLRYAGEEVSAW
jgi:rod shape-determining protein MreD